MKTFIQYQKISTAGEITAVLSASVPIRRQALLARRIMRIEPDVEQIAFLNTLTSPSRLRMMGGELSVNGTVTGCYALLLQQRLQSLVLRVEALDERVRASLTRDTVTAYFPRSLIKTRQGNTVALRGMTYRVIPGIPNNQKATAKKRRLLIELAKTAPAAGLVYYEENRIRPLIYVKATRSFVWEQACGSGSIAYALISGTSAIRQPSGGTIRITINKNTIVYKATARFIETKAILVEPNKSWYDQRRLP